MSSSQHQNQQEQTQLLNEIEKLEKECTVLEERMIGAVNHPDRTIRRKWSGAIRLQCEAQRKEKMEEIGRLECELRDLREKSSIPA